MLITKKFRRKFLRDVIELKAETLGDQKWLTFKKDFDNGLDETYSYKDMHVFSNRLGNGLLNLGFQKGDGPFNKVNWKSYHCP